jgi:hypothetical protein
MYKSVLKQMTCKSAVVSQDEQYAASSLLKPVN